jgi:hypothetical protein
MTSLRQKRKTIIGRWVAVFMALMFIVPLSSMTGSYGRSVSGEDGGEVKITINPEKTVFNYSEWIFIHVRIENHGTKNIEREDYSYAIQISEKNGKRNYHLFCYYNASMGTIPPGDYYETRIGIFDYSFDEKHPGKNLNHLPQGTYEIKAIYGDRNNPWYDPKYIPYEPTYSNSIEITVTGVTSQSPPTNLTASLSDSKVNLTWKPPSNDGNATITEYRIYRGTSSDSLELIASVNGSTTEYIDSNVSEAKTYYYSVSAVNPMGESNLSDVVSVEIPNEGEQSQTSSTPSIGFVWVVGVLSLTVFAMHRRK